MEWLCVNHGESGDSVYRRSDASVFAKVSVGGVESLAGERLRTEWLAPFDLGSAKVLDWHASHEGACLVMSAVPGIPASELRAD